MLARVVRREDFRTGTVPLVPFVTPRRKESDMQAKCVRLRDDPVDVAEVVLVWLRRIVVPQRCVAVSVRRGQTVELRERDRLDDRESLVRAS